MASRNSDRLVNLVNDLLDMEKIESGGLSYRRSHIDVRALLQTAVASHKTYGAQFDVELQLDPDIPGLSMWADPDRVMQVLLNFLSNAVKFSDPGGIVQVTARLAGDKVRVEVRDSGCGIAEEFQDKVLERFTQADASDTRAVGGTGLGLSISKALIEVMHGVIGFTSTPGEGSIFYFELPMAPASGH